MECGNGSGSSSTPLTTLKIAVLAPMPNASVRMATIAKPGARTTLRTAQRTSWTTRSNVCPDHMSPVTSRTVVTSPNSRRAVARRLLRRFAARDALANRHLEMRANLVVEIVGALVVAAPTADSCLLLHGRHEDAGDGFRELLPLRTFGGEPLSSGRR